MEEHCTWHDASDWAAWREQIETDEAANENSRPRHPCPSPLEIEKRAAEIRRRWTETERRQRERRDEGVIEIPNVEEKDLACTFKTTE